MKTKIDPLMTTFLLILLFMILLASCQTINESPSTISGKYDNGVDMILWLEESNGHIQAELLWSGKITKLEGRYYKPEIILSGIIDGINISFHLWYKDGAMAGHYSYNDGSKAISFSYKDKLIKKIIHDQGG